MRKRINGWWRIGVAGLVGAVALVALGDRGQTQVVPGGIDPLEILNLQVRANAIIVMDSSGSMTGDPGTGTDLSGDSRFSKLYGAKQVLSRVIADNQTKVSFQFGRYTQPFATMTMQGMTPNAGGNPVTPARFHYNTTNVLSPGMTVNTIVDLRSYLVPAAPAPIINLREPANSASIPILIAPGRYATGIQLATEIQTKLNAATANTYSVTYRADHRFEIARVGNGNTFGLRWTAATTSDPLRVELGFTDNDDTGSTTYTSDNVAVGDIDLFRSNAGAYNPLSGTTRYFRAYSRPFFNGKIMSLLPDGRVCSVTNDPLGPGVQEMLDPFSPTTVPTNAPFVKLEIRATCASAPTQTIRMEFAGSNGWNGTSEDDTCGGFESLVAMQPCTNNAQFSLIADHMYPELRITPAGGIAGYSETADGDVVIPAPPGTTPGAGGIRAAGFTPLAESLEDFLRIWGGATPPGPVEPLPPGPTLWSTILPMTPVKPRTFTIIVTDGDDTCDTATNNGGSTNPNARRAAYRAQLLYERIVPAEPASSVTTFVVAFGSGVAPAPANWIAWGGSGMVLPASGTGDAMAWTASPTPAQRTACTTCRDAFVAADVDALSAALQAAIDQGASGGEFSDQQSITDSIFELGAVAGVQTADPQTRYNATVPVLLQSTFVMPNYEGHLNAFNNVIVAGVQTSNQLWDAGDELAARVAGAPTPWTNQTFAQLHGGARYYDNNLGAARIKRRIFTTTRNGVFLTGSDSAIVTQLYTAVIPSAQIALWPPDPSIDPTSADGPLDRAMGLPVQIGTLSVAQQTAALAQLKTNFGACTPTSDAAPTPTACRTGQTLVSQLTAARREARQIILAHAAGAALVKSGNDAMRQTVATGVCPTADCLQYDPRVSVMAESTLAASAISTPPQQNLPERHNLEWQLFRDGPRNPSDVGQDGFDSGFGLRNPDLDATSKAFPPGTPDPRTALKPVMSVIYHGTNHMVHAFRAGPLPGVSCPQPPSAPPPVENECGGEELWAFVPFDQLSKLGERVKIQVRSPHTYVVAAPIRLTDVFVPGNFGPLTFGSATGITGTGVWRTVILFGRGIGGKYLTALDVTTPAKFNESVLSDAVRPPIAMWSRGNPDRQSGLATGIDYNNTTAAGAADFTAYSRMGQTWSTPAITFVTAAQNVTTRRPGGTEFVAFTGSGYGAASEGSTIYTLDMLTGDVVRSADIGDRGGVPYENALVAPAAAFNPLLLVKGSNIKNPAASRSTRVYIPDVHGRVWRVMTDTGTAPFTPLLFADAGANQPFANAVSMVNYDGSGPGLKPHVFVESGNENRIFPPPANTPPFRMFGLRDDDLGTDPGALTNVVSGPAYELFYIDFPNGFRGTVQPATGFTGDLARVFFAGTRFNPPATPNAPPPPPCVSSFDSVLFAVGAESGGAAYDLNASGDDRSIQLTGNRIQSIRVAGGRLVVDKGLGANNPPPPPAPPMVNPPAPNPVGNVLMGPPLNPDGTSRIPGLVTYKVNSSVCR